MNPQNRRQIGETTLVEFDTGRIGICCSLEYLALSIAVDLPDFQHYPGCNRDTLHPQSYAANVFVVGESVHAYRSLEGNVDYAGAVLCQCPGFLPNHFSSTLAKL